MNCNETKHDSQSQDTDGLTLKLKPARIILICLYRDVLRYGMSNAFSLLAEVLVIAAVSSESIQIVQFGTSYTSFS